MRNPIIHTDCFRPATRVADIARHRAPGVCARTRALAASLLLGLTVPAAAQQTPPLTSSPPAVSIVPGNTSVLPVPNSDLTSTEQTDIVFGRNIAGPYPLSWKGLRSSGESVVRDGTTLHSGTDYTLDAVAGTLTFTKPLLPNQMVRVTYGTDAPGETPNPAAVVLPLQWNLWQQGSNHLTFDSLYRADPSQPNSTPVLLNTLQFADTMGLLPSSQLTSGLYLDLGDGDMLNHSALSLAEQTKWKLAQFGLSYSRAGALFALPNVKGLTPGNEVWQANGTLTPLQGVTLQTAYQQTTQLLTPTDTAPATTGTTTTQLSNSLALALPKSSDKIQIGHTDTVTAPPGGGGQDTTQNTVQVQDALNKSTQATIGYQDQAVLPTSSASPPATYDQKTSLGITGHSSTPFSFTGTYQDNFSSTGPQDILNWQLQTSPVASARNLKLSLNWNDTLSPLSAQRSREALVELPTLGFAGLKLSGGVRQTSVPGQEVMTGLVDASLRPQRYLQVTGTLRLRDGTLMDSTPDPNTPDTYGLKVALSPWKQFSLTGSVTRNPENGDGTVRLTQAQALGLETQLGCIQFKGQYSSENPYQLLQTMTRQNTLDLTVGLRLSRFDTLTTSYQDQFSADSTLSDILSYQINFTHHLGSAVDLMLGGTMTVNNTTNLVQPDKTDLKAEAKLNLHF
jgi:hypothetical protein